MDEMLFFVLLLLGNIISHPSQQICTDLKTISFGIKNNSFAKCDM